MDRSACHRWAAVALVVAATGCACQGPCMQPAGQSVFTHVLTPTERRLFPAGDGTYYGTAACSRVCDPQPGDAGVGDASTPDSGVAQFNHVNCTVRGNDLECRFEYICGG